MSTILTGNDPSATRLVEAIAGSTGSLIGASTTSGELPLLSALDPILGDDSSPAATTQDDVPLTNSIGADQVSDLVQSVTHLLDGQDAATATTTAMAAQPGVAAATESSPLDLAGDGAITQPVLDPANALVLDVHAELETLSHQTGTSDIIHGLTTLGEAVGLGKLGDAPQSDGHTNLLTDVLNAPADVLDGNLDGVISNLGSDLTDVVHNVAGLKDAIIFGGASGDATNPIPELIQGVGNTLQTVPILSINNGDGNGGGLLDGLVGDLSHSSSNHLADVAIGPEQNQDGLVLNVLSAPEAGPHHAVELNAVDVGPTGPHLADLGVLTGDSGLGIPLLGGSGADSLAGNLLNLGTPGTAAPTTTPASAPVAETGDLDLGAIVNADHGILNLHGVHLI